MVAGAVNLEQMSQGASAFFAGDTLDELDCTCLVEEAANAVATIRGSKKAALVSFDFMV